MSVSKERLSALWAAIDEKSRLAEAAGLLLLVPEMEERKYLRPMIALACALALCLMPLVSAGEEMHTAITYLAW